MPATRKRLRPAERRALIEEAAARLFAERGYAGATLDEIAAQAGVTKPVLYRHFKSKKALHMALLAEHRNGLLATLAGSAAGSGPLEPRLSTILDAWFGFVEAHPYAWTMLFRDTTGDPEIQEFHRELQASARQLTAILIENEPELDIAAEEVEPLAELIRSATTGLALWWLDNREVPRSLLVEVAGGLLAKGLEGAERRARLRSSFVPHSE